VTVFCEHGHKLSGFIKCGEFLHNLRNYQLFKKDCVVKSELASQLTLIHYLKLV
jgi:hypothetical protein